MMLDDVRDLLLKRASKFGKRRGSLGLAGWAKHHGIPKSRCSEFLDGKRLPNDKMLEALGLEWRIVRKRNPRNPDA